MKKTIIVLFILILGISIVACSISKEDIVGTWKGTWYVDGNRLEAKLVIKSDESYYCIMYRNNNLYKEESGSYVIDGDKITLRPYSGEPGTIYFFEDGALKSGSALLTR